MKRPRLRSFSTGSPRVLVTEDAPSCGALAAVRALHAGGYEPWVAVLAGKPTYASRSRACAGKIVVPDPTVEARPYIEALAHAAHSIGASAVLPGTEQSVLTCASHPEFFSEEIALGVCDRETLALITDKTQLGAAAEQVGLPSPPSIVLGREELESFAAISYPAVVKTPQKVTPAGDGRLFSTAAQRVTNAADLRRVVASMPGERFLVQQHLGSNLEAFCGVAWHGEVVCISHQVADRIFPPNAGISAYARTVAPDEDIEHRVRLLVSAVGWSGMFQLQLVRGNERAYLIDFNPHLYGSLSLAVAAGLNLPAIWTDLLLGRPPRGGSYRAGARYRNEERDAGALFAALMNRQWRALAAGLVPHHGTTHAVFSARDPRPALTSFRHLAISQQLIAETYRTKPKPEVYGA